MIAIQHALKKKLTFFECYISFSIVKTFESALFNTDKDHRPDMYSNQALLQTSFNSPAPGVLKMYMRGSSNS